MKTKITARKIRQFYKRFALGEQYIELDPIAGIVEINKYYYWQQQKVFNHVKPLIDLYGKYFTEEELYGRCGLVSLLEPYQREYNRIMNLHSEHVSMATYGYMVVEDGSVDADELSEEGLPAGKIVIYRQGSREPELKKTTLATDGYLESAKYCLSQMINITVDFVKSHEVSNGYKGI